MRIAVLSDIHANLIALDAVLDRVGSVDEIWHLGDVVGYGPEPDAVVDRLRDARAQGVRGNHDAAAVGGSEIDYFNPDARTAMEWTRRTISRQTRDWLDALRPTIEAGSSGPRFVLVHGSPRDPIWEYVTTAEVAKDNLDAMAVPYGLHGHTHVPVAWRDEGHDRISIIRPAGGDTLTLDKRRTLLNPGSVGQPRDGDSTASWLILDTAAATVTWQRTAYDIGATQRAMTAVDLPARLIARLAVGA
jgi:diadenosine tetraphosphatase ApaH/serine/threonine PP2A family protein phosphatase